MIVQLHIINCDVNYTRVIKGEAQPLYMELKSKSQLKKGLLIFTSIYSIFFILHILFAVKDFDLGFRIIALLITLMTFFVGLIIVYLGRLEHNTVEVNRIGALISAFLAIGLGWAYSGMELNWSIILWPIGTVFCHLCVELFILGQHHEFK
jgi:hypothetical protein